MSVSAVRIASTLRPWFVRASIGLLFGAVASAGTALAGSAARRGPMQSAQAGSAAAGPSQTGPSQTGTGQPGAVQSGAIVRGIVVDPDDAVIPGATVTLTPANGRALVTTSGGDGGYVLRGVAPGSYSLTVTMPGFASFVRQGLRVTATNQTINTKLAIQDAKTVINVTDNTNAVSVDSDSNASSTLIKGKDLDALSDDPDELSSELTALAGPSAGPSGGQIYIDGFTGGQLPPKSSIREIRINQNPFSAQFERVGYGRVEVFTKPGTDKFHGNFQIQGNDGRFNTQSPFLQGAAQPDYYTTFLQGSLNGPINKYSSFTISGDHRAIETNTLINPSGFYASSAASTTPCSPGDLSCSYFPGYPTSARAIAQPNLRTSISPRVDFALGDKNTLTIRYQYETGTQLNQNLGTTTLASAASNTGSSEGEVQISDTQLVSSKIVNETRFEYNRNSGYSNPATLLPQVTVQGAFTSGGTNSGTQNNHGTQIELQNYTSVALAKNFIRAGGRLRYSSQTLTSNAGSNGTFIYSYLLDPCVANNAAGVTVTGCVDTVNPCSALNATSNKGTYYSSYQCGLASQFNLTRINNLTIRASRADVGLYVEDDWKPKSNFTWSYGLRYEAQNNLRSGHDLAPRTSLSYGIPHKNGPITVLRAGFGLFYDRFSLSNTENVIRLGGQNQVQSTYNYPNFSNGAINKACGPNDPNYLTDCSAGTAGVGATTTYSTDPNLRTSYTMQGGIGIDQTLGRLGTISVNYLNSRGRHEYLSRSIPIYGTAGSTQPVGYNYQYESGGVFNQNQLIVNARVNRKNVSLFGYYSLGFANANTSGAGSFLSTSGPNATKVDYGRAAFNRTHQAFVGGNVTLPYKVSLSPFVVAQSGQPYNVTTGVDLNGDSLYNDRPGFVNGTSASCTDKTTFTSPNTLPGTPVPINYCTGPANFSFNLRIARTFGFGPLTEAARAAAAAKAQGGPAAGGGSGGPGGRGPGGDHRGGPFGGGGGGTSTGHKYNLTLGAQSFNLFNYVVYANPVSQLTSTRFGQFTSLGGFGGGTAVSRWFLQATLSF